MAKLARGDIGDLFLARSLGAGGFEKLVIIKRIHADFMKDPAIADLFMEEARTAALIEHPNVRIVYEIGRAQAHYYIALEYLEGVPLVDILLGRRRDKRLADTRLVAALLGQTCQGLHMAHTLPGPAGGLIHGDINPRSIFVTASGTAKILDFDIVEMRGALAERHGFVRRTSAYMSPEEVRTGHCDLRSDIFSMGVVAWEALTGRRLFKQETREKTMQAIDRGRIPNAQKYRPDLSDAVNATVMRALNRDPTLRFQSARDFGTAFERAAQAEGPPLTSVNIGSLIESVFADRLRQQREFVRSARNGETAPLTARHQIVDEPVTVLAPEMPDPDDWASDTDAATRVAPDMDMLLGEQRQATRPPSTGPETFGAAIQDPFNEIAASADYSAASEAPQWTDTRNLVLSEIGVEVDDDAETGAVEIDVGDDDNSIDSYGLVGFEDPVPNMGEAPLAPLAIPLRPTPSLPSMAMPASRAVPSRVPSTIDPEGGDDIGASSFPAVPKAFDTSYDKRLSTMDSIPAGASSVSDLEAVSLRPPKKPKTSRLLILTALLALVGGAYYWLGDREDNSNKEAPGAPALATRPELAPSRAPANNTGAGAAASILAAADDGPAVPAAIDIDAGPESESASVESEKVEKVESEKVESEKVESEKVESEKVESEKVESARRARQALEAAREEKARLLIERSNKQADTKTPKLERKPPRETNPPKEAKSSGKGSGFLTVNASPYATVYVDGKKVGFTPIVKLTLKPGRHKVKLVSSEGGKSSAMTVTIQSDQVVRKNVSF